MSEIATGAKDSLGYLGPSYQLKVLWQILTDVEFGNEIVPNLQSAYFDVPVQKKLLALIKKYLDQNSKVPQIGNKSIMEHVNASNYGELEKEELHGTLKRIVNWNQSIRAGSEDDDSKAVQSYVWLFVKQQEYKKFADSIYDKIKKGTLEKNVADFEEQHKKLSLLGIKDDFGKDIFDDISSALTVNFRNPIPTGIKAIDQAMGGGLGTEEIGIILAPFGVGKALPITTKVLTPNGWVLNGSLKPLDTVIGSDGRPQTVVGIYPQGLRKIYKIEFNDQTHALCDIDHLWAVNSHGQRNAKTRISGKSICIPDHTYQILSTGEIMDDISVRGQLNYRIPNCAPVHLHHRDVKIHPYILGLILGDGCITKKNQPHIITSDLEIVESCRNLDSTRVSVTEYQGRQENYKKLYRISLLGYRALLEQYELHGCDSFTKFIPKDYLYNDLQIRTQLLQGLIDTDGTISKNGSTISYTTVSKELSIGVVELVRSLGGTCRFSEVRKCYSHNGEKRTGAITYQINISFPDNGVVPCTLKSKFERFRYKTKYANNKFIKSVTYSHDEEAMCILVDSPDHLYVMDQYIVTHNTTILTRIANTAYDLCEKNVLQLVFEDKVDEIRRKHFAIWSKIPLSQFDIDGEVDGAFGKVSNPEVEARVTKYMTDRAAQGLGGRLIVKKLNQDDVTLPFIKNWILNYQKNFGIKFDLVVLDYIDCVEPHKLTNGDDLKGELIVIKAFESMASELKIPCWTAVQGNRNSVSSEFVQSDQMGGSIKRAQKTHFLMSIARSPDQKQDNTANLQILKARFAKDGHRFENAIFNNDTLEIRAIEQSNRSSNYKPKPKEKYNPTDITSNTALDDQKKEDFLRNEKAKADEKRDEIKPPEPPKEGDDSEMENVENKNIVLLPNSKKLRVENNRLIKPTSERRKTEYYSLSEQQKKILYDFCKEMSKLENNHHDIRGKSRTPEEVYRHYLQGKIGEMLVQNFFERNYGLKSDIDWNVYDKNTQDSFDLKFKNGIIMQIKTTGSNGRLCPLTNYEYKKYTENPNGWIVLVTINLGTLNGPHVDYSIEGFTETKTVRDAKLSIFKEGIDMGNGMLMQVDNFLIHSEDLKDDFDNKIRKIIDYNSTI